MGTRYEDQPVEHWAGPESLDPTPVWKQYLLVALLLVVGLVVIVAISVVALAPQFATPPALVPGDRLVLATTAVPPVGGAPHLVSVPLVDAEHSFYLVQPAKGEVLALRARWAWSAGETECRIVDLDDPRDARFVAMDCGAHASAVTGSFERVLFDIRGMPASDSAKRPLDRYLVSLSGDRVIVNLSRRIESSERTAVPVPTGIPQPQATP
jgi:hypothetical protein